MSKFTSYCVLAGSALTLAAAAGSARASTLLYSFEAGDTPSALDGFAKNGGGVAVASTGNGATVGTGALQLTVTGTFIGALSTTQGPLTTLDNPAVTAISLDVTNATTYGGNFADLGITLFVGNPTTSDFGEQFGPPTSAYPNIDFPAGTKSSITVPLTGNSPVTGAPETYAQLLAEGYVPTGVEIVVSSDASAGNSLTVDVDNVQAVGIGGAVPEPASLSAVAIGTFAMLGRRRRLSI